LNKIFDLDEVMATTFTQIRITIINVTNQEGKISPKLNGESRAITKLTNKKQACKKRRVIER
jgi:hypothetical protein